MALQSSRALDRYQAFSAELLRIALLGLSGLGILIFKFFPTDYNESEYFFHLTFVEGWGIVLASVLFGIASAAALLHRYCSTDGMGCQLRLLRLQLAVKETSDGLRQQVSNKIADERKQRDLMFTFSLYSIRIATVCLASGGLAFAVTIVCVVSR